MILLGKQAVRRVPRAGDCCAKCQKAVEPGTELWLWDGLLVCGPCVSRMARRI